MKKITFIKAYDTNIALNLSESTIFLRVYYNSAQDRWYVDLLDSEKNVIVAGCKLSTYASIFQYVSAPVPIKLYVVPDKDSSEDLNDSNFLVTHFLYYEEI